MDKITVGGLILAWGCLIISILMDGADLHSFVKGAPAILVFGGTFGATMIGFSGKEIRSIPAKLKTAFFTKEYDLFKLIDTLVEYATKSRREGILALENYTENLKDEFMKKGLQLVVDGVDLDRTRDMLETDIAALKLWYKEGAEFFKQMGGFSPTLGIIGTVLGLIMMLAELENASEMGPAIASAFIATMYGVSAANLLYLPLANKIANAGAKDLLEKRIILEGLTCIQAGISPRIIKQALLAIIYPESEEAEKKETPK